MDLLIPSLEIRNQLAVRHDNATKSQDAMVKGEDLEIGEAGMKALENICLEMWAEYYAFSERHGAELLTDASGLFLRCAKTQIPLVDTDEVIEGEGDKLIRVEREYAA